MNKLHIPVETYGFIEVEIEGGDEEMVKKYFEVQEEFRQQNKTNVGIPLNSFLNMIDAISVGNPGSLEDFEGLSPNQLKIVQAIKRAYNRSPLAKSKVESNEDKFKKDLK